MKEKLSRFRMNMAAAAFAEAAEWETARQLAPKVEPRTGLSWWDRVFVTVTFAEHGIRYEPAGSAGCSGARPSASCGESLRGLGLRGVHMTFGTIRVEA